MQTQFKKGVLELCVLSLLRQQDYYGLELVQLISQHMDMSEGAVYPLLHRLKRDGLCTTYIQESESGPMRKYYRITPDGREQQQDLWWQWQEFSVAVEKIITLSQKKNKKSPRRSPKDRALKGRK